MPPVGNTVELAVQAPLVAISSEAGQPGSRRHKRHWSVAAGEAGDSQQPVSKQRLGQREWQGVITTDIDHGERVFNREIISRCRVCSWVNPMAAWT